MYLLGNNGFSSVFFYALSIFFFHISASVINDVSDIKVDSINAPDRLLPRGLISKRSLVVMFGALFSLGLICGLVVDWLYAIIAATLGSLYVIFYSFILPMKSNPLGSFLYLSASGLALPMIGVGIINRSLDLQTLILALLLIALGSCASISSIKDIKGDSLMNKKTFAVLLGFNRSKIFSSILIFIPLFLYPLLPLYLGLSPIFYWLLIIPGIIRFFLVYKVNRASEPNVLSKYGLVYRIIISVDAIILVLSKS